MSETNDVKKPEPLLWVPNTDPKVLARMFPEKLRSDYVYPSRLDVEAQQMIVKSQLAKCLFYQVSSSLFHVIDGVHFSIADGYNGPSKGDVDPRFAGCARVVNGVLEQGKGRCRGSHAESNTSTNCKVDLSAYKDVRMMVSLHPCYACAKHIANIRNLTTVYYLWEYGRESWVSDYLKGLGKEVIHYTSPFLENWIRLNGYRAVMEEHLLCGE